MSRSKLPYQIVLAALVIFAMGAGRLSAQNPAAAVAVDAQANQHAINPNIYGLSEAGTTDITALNAPLNRGGGDLSSTYNWQLDALNLSHDWYWESYLQSNPAAPGKSVDAFIQSTYAANVGSQPMVTIPMLQYIATVGPNANSNAASLWSFSVKKYGAQEADGSGLAANDPYQADAGSGVSAATGKDIVNNPLDAYVPNSLAIQQAWLQHLIGKWGKSTTSTGVKYYVLDNEPSLWNSTHRDIHPNPETYEELYNDIVANATAIRAADPNAKIVAPEEWTWWAMYESGLDQKNGTGAGSDYATHNNTYYYPWLLQQLYAYQQAHGTKLIDALSVHCYNQIPDDGDDSASGQATRNQYTRILWDPNYADPSWEGTVGINGGIEDWIPTLKSWVAQYYPGLEIGCTEYNWGDETALNGATAQADVEGIYGAYGLDFATRWTVPAQPTYLAMQIYRNYDGKLSTFGDMGVSATVANPDNLSSFAAVRSSDGALTVMVINKQTGTTPVTLSLANFSNAGTATAYQVSSATQTAINSLGSVAVKNNQITTTVPSQSITLFVIPAGSSLAKPTAPTGLAATTGNGTATITWLAGGGATSYTVQRSTSSSGTYVAIGTVVSPAPTSFTDTGLTNGTTYYYEVSGTNKAGTGPNSAPLAVTPQVPPVFTATATAAPATIAVSGTSTVTFTVKNTGGPITNTSVEIQVTGPGGAAAGSQVYSGQNFAANGSLTFTYAWTPSKLSPVVTLDGAYTVAVGVFNSTLATNYYTNNSATTINLTGGTAPPAFTSTATATPSTIGASGSSTVTFTVKDTGGALSNANVEVQVFNSASQAVGTGVFSGQNFTAGGTLQYTYVWTPSSQSPPVTASGNYTVEIGVFDSGWTTNYSWNGNGATITLSNAPAVPTALRAVAGSGVVTLSWTGSSGATSYSVYRGTKADSESGIPIATGVTGTTYLDSKLTNGTTYYYKVQAVNGGGSSKLSVEASATPKLTPTVRIVSSDTSSVAWGTSVTLTATVSGTGAEPTGIVNFYSGTALLGSGSLTGGVARFATSALPPGTSEINAAYGGDGLYAAAVSANVAVAVLKGTPGEYLTMTPNPAAVGTSVTFALRLNPVSGLPTPTGTVQFLIDGVSEGTFTLSGGVASWKTSTLGAGTHTFHIEYSGDADYKAVTGTITGTVTGPG